MQIQIHAKDVELTPEIKAYAEEKIGSIDKFLDRAISIDLDLIRTTKHHQQGEIFEASAKVVVPGPDIFSKFEAESLFAAIDGLEEELKREARKFKGKLEAKQMKGLRKLKNIMTSFLSRDKKYDQENNFEDTEAEE